MNDNQDNLEYEGKLLKLVTKKFLSKSGSVNAEIIRHPGAIVVAAENENHEFYLVSQFRYALEKVILEFPAGKLEPGEDSFEAAKRELIEETGFAASTWKKLGTIYGSPGFLDEPLHLFYAKNLVYVGQNLDEDEDISVVKLNIESIINLIETDKIQDAKTIALFYKVLLHQNLINKNPSE